ncbi:protein of unknown function [Candidatus Hydrogenisulfobacillus filiaventi]|uniref:HAD family hydrolase n=1 Tax=Candidatus Hydrogenisulfobacillus filiaventi TaxID=2707344 RepID=A0A6F8ZIR3_9FIRM|nr:protein of unknown function [Candidatus Hydrogenisulfobacillus filiaventi]
MLKAVILDLGNTLIEEVEDRAAPLDRLPVVAKAGAETLLTCCRAQGWALALLSNTVQSDEKVLRRLLRRLGWHDWFAVVRGTCSEGSSHRPGKPAAVVFEEVLQALGCAPAEAVMVGDTWAADIVGATAVGMHAIWVGPTAPDHPQPDTGHPMVFVGHAQDIAQVVPCLLRLRDALA